MMKLRKQFSKSIILLMGTLVFACTQNEQENSNITEEQSLQDTVKTETVEIFESSINLTDVPSQYFEVNPNKSVTIKGVKGTKITFPKGCFKNETGTISITLREYYGISDMLLGGLSTTADESLLETDGMIYIAATNEQGEQAYLEDTPCKIEILSKKRKKEMKLFEGEKSEKGINWKLTKNEFIGNTGETESVPPGITPKQKEIQDYIFQTTQLGWINCDRFLSFKNTAELVVELLSTEKGVAYSLVFYNYNSILRGYSNEQGQLVFKGLPPNEKVTLLGVGAKDEKLYYSLLDLTTDTQGAKVGELKETTKEELQTLMGNKFGNSLTQRPAPQF